jgi:hypothetical protein
MRWPPVGLLARPCGHLLPRRLRSVLHGLELAGLRLYTLCCRPAAPSAVPSGCSSTPCPCRGLTPPARSPAWSAILRDAPTADCPRSTRGSGAAKQGMSRPPALSASGYSLLHQPGPPPPPRLSACSTPAARTRLARSTRGRVGQHD